MPTLTISNPGTIATRAAWSGLAVVCLIYGGFAVWMGSIEALALAGLADVAEVRAVPPIFVIHAIAGGIALFAGVLQFNRWLRRNKPHLHRIVGRIYMGGAWAASLSGIWSALFFDVGVAARMAFIVGATLWFAATTVGFVAIRSGDVSHHREWMTRSFALALFFVMFEPWVDVLEAAGLVHAVAYPLGIFLAWSVNLMIAEGWIRRSRRTVPSLRKTRHGGGRRRNPVEAIRAGSVAG